MGAGFVARPFQLTGKRNIRKFITGDLANALETKDCNIVVHISLLRSTFHIRCGGGTGSAFTIRYNNQEFIVTARHNIEPIIGDSHPIIEVSFKDSWAALYVSIVGVGDEVLDIAILRIEGLDIVPSSYIPATSGGLTIGQQVYLLGFPLGMQAGSPNDTVFPYPLVKSGVFCGSDSVYNPIHLFVDCLGNMGFSGGPLIFHPNNDPNNPHIAGVFVQFRKDHVRLPSGGTIDLGNSGIGIAIDIRHVIAIINSNPR